MARSAILKVDVLADASRAVAGFNQVGDAAKKQAATAQTAGSKTTGAYSKVTGALKGTALAGIGLAGAAVMVGQALMDASKAAMEDEKSQKLLETAMRNNLGATDEQIASMEDWIDKTARAVGVADDELRPALQNLIIAGQSAAEAQDTLGVALDIAAAKGLDVETVSKALAKAYQGNMGSLSKLGIATKDASGETLDFEEALANAADTMGGSAAAAALTLEGQLRRTTVAVDEAKESVGELVNTGLRTLISGAEAMSLSLALARGDLDDTEKSTNALQQAATNLVHLGIDPMVEKGDLLALSMGVLAGQGELNTETFQELIDVIKPTTGEIQKAKDATKTMGSVVSVTDAQIQDVNKTLDGYQRTAEAAAEDSRFLTDRYTGLATEADKAREKAAAYRGELVKQGDEMRKLTDPIFALRDAQREYNAAFEKWSDLAVSGKGTADELAAAEDDLTEASLDLEAAELAAESGGKKMKDAWAKARAEAGLLEDATWGSKEAIDQWSRAVNNAPRWNPGTGTTGGPVPLAAGGIVTRPTLALIGEAGPEAVIPLRRGVRGGGGGVGSSYTLNITTRKADANDVAHGFRRLELLRG